MASILMKTTDLTDRKVIHDMFKSTDVDGDGRISFFEFVRMMQEWRVWIILRYYVGWGPTELEPIFWVNQFFCQGVLNAKNGIIFCWLPSSRFSFNWFLSDIVLPLVSYRNPSLPIRSPVSPLPPLTYQSHQRFSLSLSIHCLLATAFVAFLPFASCPYFSFSS